MKRNYLAIPAILILWFPVSAFSQSETVTYYVTGNVNLYLPYQSQKRFYPTMWYEKNASPKILLGGIGAGFTAIKIVREKIKLKGQSTLSRIRYWDEEVSLRSENNEPLGDVTPTGTDYTLGLTATAHYNLSGKFSFGTGLGTHFLIASVSRVPAFFMDPIVMVNRYYKVIMPVVPVEMMITFDRSFIALRYEHALLNRFKSGLSSYKTDRYGIILAEIGFKL